MEMILRNTDYALRLMVGLARHDGRRAVSTRQLADEQDVSYQLACKLLQRLSGAQLVQSSMGGKGGFRLRRVPADVSLLEIITAIQGPVCLNRCLLPKAVCSHRRDCRTCGKLHELQDMIERYMARVSLQELLGDSGVWNEQR
jgi:Rrf2 family iron-sulfur cluster assembly transcriptional regulator